MLFLGTHVSKGSKTYFSAIEEAVNKLDINTIQIFIGSPQGGGVAVVPDDENEKISNYIDTNNLILVSHSKYVLNMANTKAYSYHTYYKELEAIYKMSGIGSVIHCPKQLSMTKEEALKNTINNFTNVINKTFKTETAIKDKYKQKYLKMIIETPAGQGTEMFTTTEELAEFFHKFSKPHKKYIRFCIDTCHIFAAGYDIRTEKGMKDYLSNFNKLINKKYIILVHLNDSKFPLNNRKDRHEELGKGYITNKELGGSFAGIKYLLHFCIKNNIPIVTERGSSFKLIDEKKEIDLIKKWVN